MLGSRFEIFSLSLSLSLTYPKHIRLFFFFFAKLPSSGIGKERDWECWCGLASDAWLAPSDNYMCNELFIWDNAQQERLPNAGAGSRPRESQGKDRRMKERGDRRKTVPTIGARMRKARLGKGGGGGHSHPVSGSNGHRTFLRGGGNRNL